MDKVDESVIHADQPVDHAPAESLVKEEPHVDIESLQHALEDAQLGMNPQGSLSMSDQMASFLGPALRTTLHPHPSVENKLLQTKKARLIDKLLREPQTPYGLLHHDHTLLRATLDQIRSDIVDYHDANLQTQKEVMLAHRERDMYERQFHILRKDFCDSMSTLMTNRHQYEQVLRDYQHQIDQGQLEMDVSSGRLNDLRELNAHARRLDADNNHQASLNAQMRLDIERLQQLLQHCASLAFDKEGSPVMPYCSVFEALRTDFLALVRTYAVNSYSAESLLPSAKADLQPTNTNTSTSTDVAAAADTSSSSSSSSSQKRKAHDMSDAASTDGDAVAATQKQFRSTDSATDADVKVELPAVTPVKTEALATSASSVAFSDIAQAPTYPYIFGATPTGAEGLTDAQFTSLSPLERAQRVDLLTQHQNLLDLTGVFNPGVYVDLLRRQADQILDLQRQRGAEAIKTAETGEQNALLASRLAVLSARYEDSIAQVDCAHTEMIGKDATTTVHTLQMQALQEQSVLLKTTLKQLEILKVLDEKKYQKLLEVLQASDDRADLSEQAVMSLMERVCVVQQANETLHQELDCVTEERNYMAELIVDHEEDIKVSLQGSEQAKVDNALISGDIVELKAALKAVIDNNRALKDELKSLDSEQK